MNADGCIFIPACVACDMGADQEIADRLGLSVKTVEMYRARALEKLGLANRAALVRYALERGWLGE